jgi:hypothetical protein
MNSDVAMRRLEVLTMKRLLCVIEGVQGSLRRGKGQANHLERERSVSSVSGGVVGFVVKSFLHKPLLSETPACPSASHPCSLPTLTIKQTSIPSSCQRQPRTMRIRVQ